MKVKTWWQVYCSDKVYGFCSQDGVIIDHPVHTIKWQRLVYCREWFAANALQVVKIADICVS